MHNWEELVRQRLAGLDLDAAEKEEVQAEVAAHLEESYEALLKEGVTEPAAVQRALSQVTNWRDLQRRIFIAKRKGHFMKKRVYQLWIPGFLTLILSVVLQMMLQRLGFRVRIVGSGPNAILFYVPWLAGLPFFGALGAYLSSRAGGSRGTMVLASVFPVLALAGAFLLLFPIDVVVKWIIGSKVDSFAIVATTILRDGTGWLLLPGASLLAGGLLGQLLLSRGPSSQHTAIGSETTHA
ncbi:MAG TPA: permease prefix domain 1-containing protein [Candidatus Acidoferrum sp.]|nr:permease prefix domain 1-containing protein [Candidatus Acidoferrum sp.]